jgi:hypothetical protein
MALSTVAPIFPGFQPGQSTADPTTPVRWPGWNITQAARFNNFRQQTVNGKMLVVKYWSSPLWQWDWVYEAILDNYLKQNPYYNLPIPYTDFEILKGFFAAMQGGGNLFLYQPPDSQIGGSMGAGVITSVQITSNIATLKINNASGIARHGLYIVPSGLTGANFLNAQTLQILYADAGTVKVPFTHANYGPTADSGTAVVGQLLSATVLNPLDSKYYTELVHLIGGYPTIPLSGTPSATTAVTESVQAVQLTGLTVYAAGSSVSPTLITAANATPPYTGITLQFNANQSTPIIWYGQFYYLCRFPDDVMEWENFAAMLWLQKSFKFEQVRI